MTAAAPGASPNPELAQASLLAKLDAQDRVRDFLARAVTSGRASQSYLFLGAPGAGKLEAAWALAQALLCENGGCGACNSCIRVAHRTHPDVHYYTPESATGYLIAQVRALLDDVPLAPIRGTSKVYIVNHAEQLHANTANALLKTIEEPPEGVTFILLGTSSDVILPTIVSRCQCVPFRMVSPEAAAESVERACGLPRARCRMAVSVAGSPGRALEFLKSAERQETRRQVVRAVASLPRADEADVLASAKRICGLVLLTKKQRDKQIEQRVDEAKEKSGDFLSRGALKQLEDRFKRELNARERSGIMEELACVRSLLRDVLARVEQIPQDIVNEDMASEVELLSGTATLAGAVAALEAVSAAEANVAANVTPQLAVEVMLLDIRKALKCR